MKRLLMAAAMSLVAGASAAQELMVDYFTMLSRNDLYNSNGVQLGDFAAMLQQDRANYHRFGRADQLDQGDWLFLERGARAQIPALFANGPGVAPYIRNNALSGQGAYVYVQVFGSNGVPRYIVVSEGAG